MSSHYSELGPFLGEIDQPDGGEVTVIAGAADSTVVKYTAQTPTTPEKRQAATNVGLGATDDVTFGTVTATTFTGEGSGLTGVARVNAVGTIVAPPSTQMPALRTSIGLDDLVRPQASPDQIPDLARWYKAEDAGAAIGGTIGGTPGTWPEAQGNAAATKIGGAPTFQVNEWGAVVRFDGASDYFETDEFLDSSFDQDITCVVVCVPTADGVAYGLKAPNACASGLFFMVHNQTSVQSFFGAAGSNGASNASVFGLPVMTIASWDGTTIKLRTSRQNLEEAASSGNLGASNGSGGAAKVVLGWFGSGGAGNFFTGDIFEIMFYSRALTDLEKRKLEGYIARKYNILNKPRTVFIGDSRYFVLAGNTTLAPIEAMRLLNLSYRNDCAVLAHQGYTIANGVTYFADRIDECAVPGDIVDLVFALGVNDAVGGNSGATIWASALNFLRKRRLNSAIRNIYIETPYDAYLPSFSGGQSAFETILTDYRTQVLANYTDVADGVIDVRANTTIGDSGSAQADHAIYWGDAGPEYVHLNDAGIAIQAQVEAAALMAAGFCKVTAPVMEVGNGYGAVRIQPAATTGDYVLTLPADDGTANQVLTTDGSGVLSWGAPASGLTIGSSSIALGTDQCLLFQDGTVLAEDALLKWNKATSILTIGTGGALTADQVNVLGSLDVNLTAGDITLNSFTAGAMNNVVIGATTANAAHFTTLEATGALTYGGVTLTNAVTGTGKMVLATQPTFTDSAGAGVNFSSGHTTESGTSGSIALVANSLTSGTGLYIATSGATFTGKLIDLSTTAATTGTPLNISMTGSAAGTQTGIIISNTRNGGSSVNKGLTITCQNGSTNTALDVAAGSTNLQATTLQGALTYGGVTLSNAVTGTGNMVLSASPTGTGTWALPIVQATSVAIGGATIGTNALAVTGTSAFSSTIYGDTTTPNITLSNANGAALNYGSSSAFVAGGAAHIDISSAAKLQVSSGAVNIASASTLGWTSSGAASGTLDTNLSRLAAGVAQFGTSAANTSGWFQWAGEARVTTQFDKTTNTTLADITGTSIALLNGRKYRFLAQLDCTLDATGGGKYAMAFSSTVTSINYRVRTLGASSAVLCSARQTSSGSAVNSTASLTDDAVWIEGVIVAGANGNLTVQFAQQSSNGTSSVLTGSTLMVWDVP